ncbi:MAG: TonB-dependent receptor [Acidobacteriia bacterium]|nr:TonB-dependent receptor [Terriglobia bacterium]
MVDATAAVVPDAKIVLLNSETGLRHETFTTATGNYTLTALPVGSYGLTVERTGFKTYQQTNIRIQVAVTTRVDVELSVGQTSESVEVSAQASMLKTESAEQSSTISGDTINDLPINFGIGAGAIRNPLSFVQLTPGSNITGWNTIQVNGLPQGSFRILFEGQESNNGLDGRASDEVQPSVEAIGEFTLQTSNFAAEFGQVGGGLFNFTARSGTNQYHGSAYGYFANEALNAGIPFTDDGQGHHNRPKVRRMDWGFSAGGPVWIPKVFNGKNRTFFFFNYERYRDKQNAYMGLGTVPTAAMRGGDFGAILTGRNLGTDFAGRAILENTIYDPKSRYTDASGRFVVAPYGGNKIAANLFDPVAAKILAEIPLPTNPNSLVNNYTLQSPFRKIQGLPSIKIDHNVTAAGRLSFYFAKEITDKDVGQDGYPDPISIRRDLHIQGTNARLNYDDSLSPRLLLHLGAGVQRYVNPDSSPADVTDYDAAGKLGIKGTPGTGFPRLSGMGTTTYGGLAQSAIATSSGFGPANRGVYYTVKPTGVAQLTWVRGNHTYKAGGEWKIDSFTNWSAIGLSPSYGFSSSQTAQPLYGQSLPGGTTIGHPFASFLLGLYNSAGIGNTSNPQYRKSSWGFFVQDTWKVTRRLTLDYGIRYDVQKPMRELWARTSIFSPSVVNPNANGLLGGTLYEGDGPGRCNCHFVKTYPYAFAPRLGVAYQLDDKTVLRGGWGFVYSFTNIFGYIGGGNSAGMGFNTINYNAPGNGVEAGGLNGGLVWSQQDLYGASYDPGLKVVPNAAVQGAQSVFDPNGGRPPRINQWNISIQREVSKDLVVEVSYVGNRAVWLNANGLINYNAYPPEYLTKMGYDITQPAVRTLLTSSITSSVAVAAGFKKPYANFPSTGTVLQALKPFPQFSGIGSSYAPLGKTWYDAFQAKATKRLSRGLSMTASYAFSKNLDNTSGSGNIYNRDTFKSLGIPSSNQPHILTMSIDYQVPAFGFAAHNTAARLILADWHIGSVLQYASGNLLGAPGSNNSLGTYYPSQATRQFRVPGVPLFLKNPNCGCIDPTQETILNPAAWIDEPTGVWGTGTVYYNDFRGQRRPSESVSLTKAFPIRERMRVSFRAEFFNIFNRMESFPNPSTSNPATPPTRSNGMLTGGFGFINYTQITSNSQNNSYPSPRTGQLVLRFEF